MLGLDKNIVKLVPHDKSWNIEFEKEKDRLKSIMGDTAIAIEHVGSTAIPNLCAKPIIDIAVGVKDKSTLYELIPLLTKYGYDCKNSIESEGELLARVGPESNRTHYIHIEVFNDERWNKQILFRDYLLKHPEYAKQYADLKQQILKSHNDRASYTPLKKDFIDLVVAKAKMEKGKE